MGERAGGQAAGGSKAVAVAVGERWLGQFHHGAAAFPDDLGGPTKQLLCFSEGLSQLLLPLDELWVTLCGSQGERQGSVQSRYNGKRERNTQTHTQTHQSRCMREREGGR